MMKHESEPLESKSHIRNYQQPARNCKQKEAPQKTN